MSKYCFSINGENFFGSYPTRGEALDHGRRLSGDDAVVFTGKCIFPDLQEMMTEFVEKNITETTGAIQKKYQYTDNWMKKKRPATTKRILVNQVTELLSSYFSEINFYSVEDIKEHSVGKHKVA